MARSENPAHNCIKTIVNTKKSRHSAYIIHKICNVTFQFGFIYSHLLFYWPYFTYVMWYRPYLTISHGHRGHVYVYGAPGRVYFTASNRDHFVSISGPLPQTLYCRCSFRSSFVPSLNYLLERYHFLFLLVLVLANSILAVVLYFDQNERCCFLGNVPFSTEKMLSVT